MRFVKVYLVTLFFCLAFVFFGGHLLFHAWYTVAAVCALPIGITATILLSQSDRIDRLEERLRKLEEKSDPAANAED